MLNDRKLQILYAIINSYIFTAEPIGSRVISKKYELGISSATIRNEMSDLEELGYLNKTHSSSGRIPSDKAYRHYVDYLVNRPFINLDKEDKILLKNLKNEILNTEQSIGLGAKILSSITNYAAVSLIPNIKDIKMKRIQLSIVDENLILCVIVFDNNMIENFMLRTKLEIDEDSLVELNDLLNKQLFGTKINDIETVLINNKDLSNLSNYEALLKELFNLVKSKADEHNEFKVSLQGLGNLFKYPEYKDASKAKEIINFLENTDNMYELLDNFKDNNLVIKIGSENQKNALEDSAIVLTSVMSNDNTIGYLGIIGPMRMNYDNVISTLLGLTDILKKNK